MRKESIEQVVGWIQTGKGPVAIGADGRRVPFKTSHEFYDMMTNGIPPGVRQSDQKSGPIPEQKPI